jgi:predicted nucleic acid-binding protein
LANIFWDTNLFIYLLEDSPGFGATVQDLRRRMLRRNDRLFTSAMTIGEVLVKPLSTGHNSLAERYRALLAPPKLTLGFVRIVDFIPRMLFSWRAPHRPKSIYSSPTIAG